MRFPLWLHIDCGCHVADMAHMFMCLIDKHAESQGVIKNNASAMNTRIGKASFSPHAAWGGAGRSVTAAAATDRPSAAPGWRPKPREKQMEQLGWKTWNNFGHLGGRENQMEQLG